jgi:hypothetical protein
MAGDERLEETIAKKYGLDLSGNGRREPEQPDPPEHHRDEEHDHHDDDQRGGHRDDDHQVDEPIYQFTPGGSFILDTSPDPEPLWGNTDQVGLADGEALIFAGAQGLGKTTLAQQLTLGRCGFEEYATLLGFPISTGSHALYLAMDRPKQVARSFRRMVGEAWRDELNSRLSVWQGPPPYDLAKYPALLLKLCQQAEADTVIVDSLKDAAVGLSDDEVGAAYNRARQHALAAGIQVIELHHIRKLPNSRTDSTISLDDLYGSTWLPSGAGSVILLTGNAGDPIVGLQHLKQPNAEIGPFKIMHDWETGRSTIWHTADLVLLAQQPGGVTALDAARALFDTEDPTRNDKEKARRRLQQLEKSGQLTLLDPGGSASKQPAIWGPK